MLAFHRWYFGLALLILGIEILIAVYVRDDFIRPYVGDVLVVILIYCFVKTFLNIPVMTTSVLILLFAFTVELLQLFNIVKMLGWENSGIARIVIGSSFSWMDMLAYILGIVMIMVFEKYRYERIESC